MRRLIVILGLLTLATAAGAVEGDTLWTRLYGIHGGTEIGYRIIPAENGHFLVAGLTSTYPVPTPGTNMWLLNVDITGDTLWTRAYCGNNYVSDARAIISAGNEEYLLAGRTGSWITNYFQGWLVKVNADGDSIWSRTYGSVSGQFSDIIPANDSGYLMAGFTGVFFPDYGWVVKIDTTGYQLWQHTYNIPSAQSIQFTRCISTGDGYMMTGWCWSVIYDDWSILLVKINDAGDTLWTRVYGDFSTSFGYSIIPSEDGNFLVAGSGLANMLLIKVDSWGDILWSNDYGTYEQLEIANDVIHTADGGYLLSGYNHTTLSERIMLIKVTAQGDSLWSRYYSEFQDFYDREATAALCLENGNYLVTGFTQQNGPIDQGDLWLAYIEGPSIPRIDITLTPLNPPITIPLQGGSFQFNASARRNVGPQAPFVVWARIKDPDGTYTPPTLGPVNINPPVNVTVTRQRNQNIPGSWEAGTYTYLAYANTTYSYPAIDSSSFTFIKSTTADEGVWITEATCTGEPFPGEVLTTGDIHPSSFSLQPCSPNPFNPTTVLSYELRVPSLVSLKVYDTAGRLVETLVDGWREAGDHEITFDGSKLSSGIYLAKLEAGDLSVVQKLVLLK